MDSSGVKLLVYDCGFAVADRLGTGKSTRDSPDQNGDPEKDPGDVQDLAEFAQGLNLEALQAGRVEQILRLETTAR
jgi:hypothetical protein